MALCDPNGAGPTPQAYHQQRYRSWDQAWVNAREQWLLRQLLTQYRVTNCTVLDVPCGYGRFMPLYTHLGITAIGVDVCQAMVSYAMAQHMPSCHGRWLCANILALPFAAQAFDSVLCLRLLHHRYSDAERQQILGELGRVARRFVILSFYRCTPLHALARHWRGTHGRLAMMRLSHVRRLAQASGLVMQHVAALVRFCHAQTFVVFAKTSV